jgi:hypothetical protein
LFHGTLQLNSTLLPLPASFPSRGKELLYHLTGHRHLSDECQKRPGLLKLMLKLPVITIATNTLSH